MDIEKQARMSKHILMLEQQLSEKCKQVRILTAELDARRKRTEEDFDAGAIQVLQDVSRQLYAGSALLSPVDEGYGVLVAASRYVDEKVWSMGGK